MSHVSCPTCKALAGKPCSVPSSHQARFRRAHTQRRS
ncbi:zinc finger domain-containing protein [Streptomyces mirabilis]